MENKIPNDYQNVIKEPVFPDQMLGSAHRDIEEIQKKANDLHEMELDSPATGIRNLINRVHSSHCGVKEMLQELGMRLRPVVSLKVSPPSEKTHQEPVGLSPIEKDLIELNESIQADYNLLVALHEGLRL